MDRRQNQRITALLPVKVWGMDKNVLPFAQQARVKNISGNGAVLQGMQRQVLPGEFIHVQLGKDSAQFRVVWVGKNGTPREGEIGIQNLPAEPHIWDINPAQCTEFAGKG